MGCQVSRSRTRPVSPQGVASWGCPPHRLAEAPVLEPYATVVSRSKAVADAISGVSAGSQLASPSTTRRRYLPFEAIILGGPEGSDTPIFRRRSVVPIVVSSRSWRHWVCAPARSPSRDSYARQNWRIRRPRTAFPGGNRRRRRGRNGGCTRRTRNYPPLDAGVAELLAARWANPSTESGSVPACTSHQTIVFR